jgi:large subunit ribosomal protein L3
MIQGIIGKKIGMSHMFSQDGQLVALTAIEAGPCFVTQIKTSAKEGYDAAQLGFGETKRLNSPQSGHLQRKGVGVLKYLREFEVDDPSSIKVGQKIDVSTFKVGELVDITGISKGKGFAGVVKRYHFAGGPKTHGQSDRHRAPGSIGATTSPGRVLKGKHMAGHMGSRRNTVRHLKVMNVDPTRNFLFIKGAVPGAKNGLLLIRKSLNQGRGQS